MIPFEIIEEEYLNKIIEWYNEPSNYAGSQLSSWELEALIANSKKNISKVIFVCRQKLENLPPKATFKYIEWKRRLN